MNHAAVFAQHFSRLVWIAMQETPQKDAELEFTARAAEALLRIGPARLSVQDLRLIVGDEMIPDALSGAPDLLLASRLAAHAIEKLEFAAFTPRSELIASSKVIATEPQAGDAGKATAALLQPLNLRRVLFAFSGAGASDSTSAAIAEMDAVRRKFSTPRPLTPAGARTPTGARTPPGSVSGERTPVDAPSPVRGAGLVHIESDVFNVIDKASAEGRLARAIDDLLRAAENAASKGDTQRVFETMYAIVSREPSSRSGESRTAFVMGIKRLGTRALLIPLARHLLTHRELEEQVLAIFARIGDDAAELLVEELAESQQRVERRAIFDLLGKLKTGRAALIHGLRDPRWYVARNSAELLGQMQATDAVPALEALVTHTDERVRRSAVSALVQMSTVDVSDRVLRALSDASAAVRATAASGLGSRRSARVLDALLDRLQREDEESVQIALLDALGRNGSPTAVKKLMEAAEASGGLFKRKSTTYRAAAASALKGVDSPDARAMVERLRKDKEAAVRAAAGG